MPRGASFSRVMKLAIFGLTVSSSWGNGHATLWRGLIRALAARGVEIDFFERDVPYYAQARDLTRLPGGGTLHLYEDWADIAAAARGRVMGADATIVTSYCPDAISAARLMEDAPGQTIFYDLDTPVTLARLGAGEAVAYLPSHGLAQFDLVLSYTGGRALSELRERLGARRVAPLYGHVDPQAHAPARAEPRYGADLSYIGTYAADRQPGVDALFVGPARARPDQRFVLAGSGYPDSFPWTKNTWFVRHLPPAEHPAFYAASRCTLNVTRADMKAYGWCPSGRLFEAAACGAPILTDTWDGLDAFFTPGEEVLTAETTDDALAALARDDLPEIARRARQRVLAEHTSAHRADELIALLERVPA